MITVLFFAQLQESAGCSQFQLEQQEMTIKQLKNVVQQQYPTVALQHVMTAVNEEFVLEEEVVKTGDVVAFIPPVSGG